ncbi:MAG: hypothetical protein NVSMB28_15810 [Collimonas sp.]
MILPEPPPHPATGLGKSEMQEVEYRKPASNLRPCLVALVANSVAYSVAHLATHSLDGTTRAVKSFYHPCHDIQSLT